MKDIQHDFIGISFGDREPPYSNWYYVGLVFITENGNEARVADHASTISPVKRREQVGKEKIGKKVGFGKFKDEIVVDYRVTTPDFKPHPDGIRIRVKDDANLLLIGKISEEGLDRWSGYTAEQHRSRDQLKKLAGREFEVMADECVPQVSSLQFFNTMPDDDAPAGFFLPRGVCEVISSKVSSATSK